MLLSHGRWNSHTRSACRTSRRLSLKNLSSLLMVIKNMCQIYLVSIFFHKIFLFHELIEAVFFSFLFVRFFFYKRLFD